MAGWLVGRAGPDDLTPDRRHEVMTWLESLGVDPTNMALQLAVTHTLAEE